MRTLPLHQPSRKGFTGFVPNELIASVVEQNEWKIGEETLKVALGYFLQSDPDLSNIEIGLINKSSCNAMWYPTIGLEEGYAIGINRGLIDTLRLVAYDVFGHGDEKVDEDIKLAYHDSTAVERVKERVGAFLETGFPLGNYDVPSPRRRAFVEAILEDAYQFVVLHEFAHIALGHLSGNNVRLLRSRRTDSQIATFSIGQEHQADRLACRFHSAIRRNATQRFPGMEFCGPTLFLGVLGLFERYQRYATVFDAPHSHPPAYERLYRMRVRLSMGDGDQYWSVRSGDGFTLARMDLAANPEAIRFSDALSDSLLRVLEGVEASEDLPSPFLTLVNRFGDVPVTESSKAEFRSEICRWLLLGSPERVVQHLYEGQCNAQSNAKSVVADDDRMFWMNSRDYLQDAIDYIRMIPDRSVKEAFLNRQEAVD